jgi:hypothetical protein
MYGIKIENFGLQDLLRPEIAGCPRTKRCDTRNFRPSLTSKLK